MLKSQRMVVSHDFNKEELLKPKSTKSIPDWRQKKKKKEQVGR